MKLFPESGSATILVLDVQNRLHVSDFSHLWRVSAESREIAIQAYLDKHNLKRVTLDEEKRNGFPLPKRRTRQNFSTLLRKR